MIEHGSKEHTQFAYEQCKIQSGNDTETIIGFMDFLKSKGKLEQLKDMDGLTEFEIQLIESKLAE